MIIDKFQFRCSLCGELSEEHTREMKPEDHMMAPPVPVGWKVAVITVILPEEEEGPVMVEAETGEEMCPHRLLSLTICPTCYIAETDLWEPLKAAIGGVPTHLKVLE